MWLFFMNKKEKYLFVWVFKTATNVPSGPLIESVLVENSLLYVITMSY